MLRGMEPKRADLIAELTNDTGYWGMVGNDDNLTQAVDGASALANGAAEVRVGHTVYVVDESADTTPTT
jgi:X-X-X-Leu-X-X-Gly heptad repeat protein